MSAAQRLSRWFFYLLLLPTAIGVSAWQGWRWWSWASAPPLPVAEQSDIEDSAVLIEIPEGTSAQQIGADLEAAGLIRSSMAWNLWTRWQTVQNREGGFLAGTYELSPADPLAITADKVWQGDVVELTVTVPEGWSMSQMADYFEAQGLFSAADFLAATEQIPRDRFSWLPDDIPHLEGFLYPDTYRLPDPATPEILIDQMLTRFQDVALPIYQQSESPYSLLEWVTLASIVEREAVVPEERGLIAGVFARRLSEGMPLGADPTVEYALGIQQTPEDPLTYAEVSTPSPYNTYVNVGLPPTPIASPGTASLEASLAPAENEYLYFMARFDGTHIFSRTLAEHEAAKVKVDNDLSAQQEDSSSVN